MMKLEIKKKKYQVPELFSKKGGELLPERLGAYAVNYVMYIKHKEEWYPNTWIINEFEKVQSKPIEVYSKQCFV